MKGPSHEILCNIFVVAFCLSSYRVDYFCRYKKGMRRIFMKLNALTIEDINSKIFQPQVSGSMTVDSVCVWLIGCQDYIETHQCSNL